MKPEGMSEKAWVELHRVIAKIEAKVNAKIQAEKKQKPA
jgi:hypothetical protein